MKIFNPQSKKSLFYASLVIGLVLNIFSMLMVVRSFSSGALEYMTKNTFRGVPLPISTFGYSGDIAINSVKYTDPYVFIPFILNFIFWILVVFMILFIIRKIKYKKTDINSASASNPRSYPR
jgi:large-conductance mechanosensitive channel